MSKFQTIHNHQKNITDIFVHLLVPGLSYLASPAFYSFFKLEGMSAPLAADQLVANPLISSEKFANMLGGGVLSLSAAKYGWDGVIPEQKVILTHLDGHDSSVTIKAQETWSDIIMKCSPALVVVDFFTAQGGYALLGGAVSFALAAYEAIVPSTVKYNFYENGHKLTDLAISITGEQILENGISIPFHFIE